MWGISDPDSPVDTAKLTLALINHEGTKSYVYDDKTGEPIVAGYTVQGNPTIGNGRLLTKIKGLSPDEIAYLRSNDLRDCIREAEAQDWWPHVVNCEPRARALCELVFILGSKFQSFHKTIAALLADDFNAAADEIINSALDHEDGARINVLAEMIRTGSG